mmetsp:Transcript_27666/g.51412  ORF Transcript_27666/g.51412 Transcript_27666/m.51412 type:complete len:348 (+) Transcript_27666:988-2031(+)
MVLRVGQVRGNYLGKGTRHDRIAVAHKDHGRAPERAKRGAKIQATMFVFGPIKVHCDGVLEDQAGHHIGILGFNGIERKTGLQIRLPAFGRWIGPIGARDLACFGPADVAEGGIDLFEIHVGRGAGQDQRTDMIGMPGGIGLRDIAAERRAIDNGLLDLQYVAKPTDIIAPLGQGPSGWVAVIRPPVAPMIDIDHLTDVAELAEPGFEDRVVGPGPAMQHDKGGFCSHDRTVGDEARALDVEIEFYAIDRDPHQAVALPPDWSKQKPVLKLASSEASQQAMAAISSIVPNRPMGIFERMKSMWSWVIWSNMAVCTAAGAMALQVTPDVANSLPSDLVRPITAALDAE